jgi:hypothetical protein
MWKLLPGLGDVVLKFFHHDWVLGEVAWDGIVYKCIGKLGVELLAIGG